jgi:hypothetical protein
MQHPMETMPHPSSGVLTAFAEGRLTPALLSEVEGHLAACESCRATLKAIPPSGLEALVREAVAARSVGNETVVDQASSLPVGLSDHPRYRVTVLIGAGGMGTVYRAEHRLMKRAVAVKVIGSNWSQRPNLVARFCREVEAVAKLSHPNIATAFDAEQVGETLVLVTELIDGHDLDQVVARRGALPVVEACEFARQAASGLQHAHDRGIVHRDIKPSNLMLTPDRVVRILDFGLAALGGRSDAADLASRLDLTQPGGSITDYGERCGTPDYMAPEQRRDAHTADARADVYSLGRTLRFLLTGDAAGDLSARRDVPAALVAVVTRMTATDPSDRYATAALVVEALTPFLSQRTTRRRWLAAVCLAGAVGVGLLIWSKREVTHDGVPEMPSSYLQFSRPTDTLVFPGRVELDATCTIEARVMLTTDDAKDWCVFNQWESGKEDLYLGVSPGGISGCCHPVANVDARCRVALNVWHHVAFVCDETQARLYLDGKLVGAAAAKGKIGKGKGLPTIGAIWRPPEEPRGSFIGNLHWLRISNVGRYGKTFEPPVHAPEVDATTLMSFPGEASQQNSRQAAGFIGATAPESKTQSK